MTAEIPKVLADAFEQVKQEAYASGWNDAVQAIRAAMDGLETPSAPTQLKFAEATLPQVDQKAVAATNGKSPTIGSTPYYVLSAVKTKPGMGSTEVVSAVKSSGHNVSDGSIRTSLFRLRDRKSIVLRHGKWFPV